MLKKNKECSDSGFGFEGICADDIPKLIEKAIMDDNTQKSIPEFGKYLKPVIDKLKDKGMDKIKEFFNFCVGDFKGSDLAKKSELTCDVIPYEDDTTMGTIAIKIGHLPCGTSPTDITVCFTFSKCGSFGLAFNGGLLTCAAAATGIGEIVAPFLQAIASVGFAFSINNNIVMTLNIYYYDSEKNNFVSKAATMEGNIFLTVNLSLAAVLFGDTKIGKKKLSDIFDISGNVSALIDLVGKRDQLDKARNVQHGGQMDFITNLLKMKGEVGLKIHASCVFKLSEFTNGFLPDITIGTVDFNMLASMGGGHSGMKKGLYISLNAKLSFLTDFYNAFKNTVGKVFEFFGITLPDLNLDIGVDVALAIQEDAIGIMLKGNFFGIEPQPLTCIYDLKKAALSCDGLGSIFSIIKQGIEWVVRKGEQFFKAIGEEIKFAMNEAGQWIAKNIVGPMDRFFKGQCRCTNGKEQSGLLCYDKCKDNYYGVMNRCIPKCPPEFRNDGDFCYKPDSYGRGVGYVIWDEGKCNSDHSQGCEKTDLMWYPKCRQNFHNVACCVCSPDCPPNMTDIGISCHKKDIYYRDSGSALDCSEDGSSVSQNKNDEVNKKYEPLKVLIAQGQNERKALEEKLEVQWKEFEAKHMKKMVEIRKHGKDLEKFASEEYNSKKAKEKDEKKKNELKKKFSDEIHLNNFKHKKDIDDEEKRFKDTLRKFELMRQKERSKLEYLLYSNLQEKKRELGFDIKK